MISDAGRDHDVPTLAGHHEWRLLHVGKHADLWACMQSDFCRPVAVKVFHSDFTSTELARRRVGAIGRSSGLRSSVPLLSVATLPDGRTAMVMPLLEGSLSDRAAGVGAAEWETWFVHACEALEELHSRGISHANLHPANILVSSGGSVLLSDADCVSISGHVGEADAVGSDLRSLVASFATVAPNTEAASRLMSVLGAQGDHLAVIGIDSASRLAQFIPRELRRPTATTEVVEPSRWAHRSVVLGVGAVSVSLAALTILILMSNRWGETATPSTDDDGGTQQTETSEKSTHDSTRPLIKGSAANISVSGNQACSRLADGSGVCWGSNLFLGESTTPEIHSDEITFDARPFPLQGGPFEALDIGSDGTGNETLCAVAGGNVACRGWGLVETPVGISNEELNRSDILYAIPGIDSAVDVTVGTQHACALLADTSVHCWGSDAVGQLGDGTPNEYGNSRVPGLTGITDVVAGWEATCALKVNGSVWCWGLAEPPLGTVPTPTQVAGVPPIAQLAVGRFLVCGVESNGRLWCWGDYEQAFGIRNANLFTPPTIIDGAEPVSHVSTNESQLCVIASGSVRCNTERSAELRKIPGIDDVVQVDTDPSLSCALQSSGSVWCWGISTEDYDNPRAEPEPVQIEGLG